MEENIKYGAFTTVAQSIRQFMQPALMYFNEHGFNITIGAKYNETEVNSFPKQFKYKELDIDRGLHLWKTIKNIRVLYKFFKKEKFDIIEYGTENVSMCASIAGWLAGVPCRIYNHWGARYVGFTGITRFISITIERINALFSTDIVQSSNENLELCVRDKVYPREKVQVIGYGGTVGADFKKFDRSRKDEWNLEFRKKWGIPETDIIMGDVGFVRRDKGTNELLTAFKNINNPHLWLVFIGEIYMEDAPDAELLSWAQENNHIVFTGKVMDVEHHLAAYDVLVHPSYREGFGMVIQEAGAMGIPYITTNIPGPREIGVDGVTGLLVNPKDAKDLEDKMRTLIDNREKLFLMSEAVYELTNERYERNKMVRRIYEHRLQLIKKYKIKLTI